LLEQGQWSGKLWNRRRDGSLFREWLNISRVPMPPSQPQRFVSIMADAASDAAGLMKQADMAMYIAKAEGPQRWHRLGAPRLSPEDPAAAI
jgi:hypothetical protein